MTFNDVREALEESEALHKLGLLFDSERMLRTTCDRLNNLHYVVWLEAARLDPHRMSK